jgi:hypothetical protein
MTQRFVSPLVKFTTDTLQSTPGATLTFSVSGSSTGKAVYADKNKVTSLGTIVTADSAGIFVPIWLDGTYRATLRSASTTPSASPADGMVQTGWPIDNVGDDAITASTLTATGAITGASIAVTGASTAATSTTTGATTGNTLVSTTSTTTATLVASGAITGASVAVTGAVTGATATTTGTTTANALVSTTSVTSATVVASGAITGASLTVSGVVNGSSLSGGSVSTTGAILSSGSGGVGYAAGAGGAVTQATSKVTAFTLSKVCGTIQFAADALGADTTTAGATWTNTAIAATDLVVFTHDSGGTLGAYNLACTPGAGSAVLKLRNITPGSLSEAPVFRFAVIKGVVA